MMTTKKNKYGYNDLFFVAVMSVGITFIIMSVLTFKVAVAYSGSPSNGDYKIVSPSGVVQEKCKATSAGFDCRDISGRMLYKVVFE